LSVESGRDVDDLPREHADGGPHDAAHGVSNPACVSSLPEKYGFKASSAKNVPLMLTSPD
jgi:hypothetical protein